LGPVAGRRKYLECNFVPRKEGGISWLAEWLILNKKFVPFDLPVCRR